MERTSAARLILLTLLLGAAVFIGSLFIGAMPGASWEIVAELRLPRAILALAVGMGLAISGAALQALFSNPLCEPYTLGLSSGAAFGAALGASLGLDFAAAGLGGSAFIGALAFAAILYGVSLRPGTTNLTLLLTGVMLGFLGSSLLALWMTVADSRGIQGALLWLFGDLSRARMSGAIASLVGVIALSSVIAWRWRDLDALLMGEEGAASLGVDVSRARRRLVLLNSVLIGICVAGGGMIGFLGLVVPHFARQFVGSLHRRLLPLCAAWGGISLVAADCLARSVVSPYELPVGVVTAILGAPLFLTIMLRRGGSTT